MSTQLTIDRRLHLEARPAKFFKKLEDNSVSCYLCPRHCTLKPEQNGFCQVRGNRNGELKTFNYGVSVQITEELIETEAVLHYAPGSKILSLGNVGCMMNCSFCHNWKTSQAKFVEKENIRFYSPEYVVETAIKKGIKVLSWTYNDPVVWHEFVYDTAVLAKKAGLINLYKSAFYIGPEAVSELLEVIDIFSLSLKSMDSDFYKKVTKGRLEPVLDAIKQIYNDGRRHLEISNLVVTGMNDNLTEIDKVINWVKSELDDNVPIHFVRFHPDYKYTNVERTSISFLKSARMRAKEQGLKNVYLGNVFESGEHLNTNCLHCGALQVERFGISSKIVGIKDDGKCSQCNKQSLVKQPYLDKVQNVVQKDLKNLNKITHQWVGDINSIHVSIINSTDSDSFFAAAKEVDSKDADYRLVLAKDESRFLISRKPGETYINLFMPMDLEVKVLGVLDRAHFPTETPVESRLNLS